MYTTNLRKSRDSAVSYHTSNVRKSKNSAGSYSHRPHRASRTSATSHSDTYRKTPTEHSFPATLPEVPRHSSPLRIFTSLEEKIALENALRIIKKHYRKHAAELTLNLFAEHEFLLEKFRSQNGKFKTHSLNNHMLFVLDFIESCVRLDFCSHKLLGHVQNKHFENDVGKKEAEVMAEVIKQYWKSILVDQISITYTKALDNLLDRIIMHVFVK